MPKNIVTTSLITPLTCLNQYHIYVFVHFSVGCLYLTMFFVSLVNGLCSFVHFILGCMLLAICNHLFGKIELVKPSVLCVLKNTNLSSKLCVVLCVCMFLLNSSLKLSIFLLLKFCSSHQRQSFFVN
jgi:hypothetical protein